MYAHLKRWFVDNGKAEPKPIFLNITEFITNLSFQEIYDGYKATFRFLSLSLSFFFFFFFFFFLFEYTLLA